LLSRNVLDIEGNTPLVRLNLSELNINLYAKLESYNRTGSVKDRAAAYILNKLLSKEEIDRETTIIESSSGNFGIALSAYCKAKGLKFYCVIDPNISVTNEFLIRSLSSKAFKVTEPDSSGGYLLNRIKKVKELREQIPNSYWVNQYGNPYNAEAYFHSLGEELCNQMDNIDYIFIGVSSGGTITGVSQKIKRKFPGAKVIAVDIVGSVIFGGPPKKRYIPGIGSSMVPEILKHAKIDDVMMMNEKISVNMCYELLERYTIFAGGSSGSVYAAVKEYFAGKEFKYKPDVVVVFPDRGDRYIDTIYNQDWCDRFMKQEIHMTE
jgi:2,3-diaminopropionate biosynthesis protein SbnA